jgi:4-diphosphocytidyl-2-C-methyl-D-erythritol kinase
VRKRKDGFHDIESVFYPAGLSDTIEINYPADGQFRFSGSGIPIPGDPGSNLCIKAFELMKSRFRIPAVTVHLNKAIPVGSGLGGGSSDGAFILKALNEMFLLGLKTDELKDFASSLGSDCVFFIENIPVVAKGRGDVLAEVAVNLQGFFLMIVVPPVYINTAEAYSMVHPAEPATSVEEIIRQPVSRWKELLINDFEEIICKKYPLIRRIKEILYENNAVYSSMSGSGSAVYGLFRQAPRLEGLFPGCFVWMSSQL